MSRYLDLMRSVSKTRPIRWTMSRIQAPLDMRFKGTRFAISKLGAPDVPLCYLTATGRRSGEPRTVPLTYMPVGSSYAVVASNYGRDNHPAWSHNLDATPEATLEIDGTAIEVVARRATTEEVRWPSGRTSRPSGPATRSTGPSLRATSGSMCSTPAQSDRRVRPSPLSSPRLTSRLSQKGEAEILLQTSKLPNSRASDSLLSEAA